MKKGLAVVAKAVYFIITVSVGIKSLNLNMRLLGSFCQPQLLYDHFLPFQLIFVPGNTKNYFFSKLDKYTAGVVYMHLFSVCLPQIYLHEKK